MSTLEKRFYTEADYYKFPEDVRAELIEGQIHYYSMPNRIHQSILAALLSAIHAHIKAHQLPCQVYPGPFAVKLKQDSRTIVEPDISVIFDPEKLTERGCSGAPDWIIEISSPANPSHDYIRKLHLYADAGVREYWIVNPMKQSVYVYNLETVEFGTVPYTFHDKIKANIFDELIIDFQTLGLD